MDSQSTIDKLKQLREPFSLKEIKWRAGRPDKERTRAYALPYIEARAVSDRLDDIMGPANWKTEFRAGPSGGVVCSLALRVDGEWIAKENGADNTDLEAVKGGLSDSFKRAATMWGIGRYLYAYDAEVVSIDKNGRLAYTPPLPDEFLPEAERGKQQGANTSVVHQYLTADNASLPAEEPAASDAKAAVSAPESKTEVLAAPEVANADDVAQASTVPAEAATYEPVASASSAEKEVPADTGAAVSSTVESSEAPAAAQSEAAAGAEAMPEGLTPDEVKRVEGLLLRLDKGVSISIIRDYVNGDKCRQAMCEAARNFVLARLDKAANKAEAATA